MLTVIHEIQGEVSAPKLKKGKNQGRMGGWEDGRMKRIQRGVY